MTTTDTQAQQETQPWVPELTFAARLALVRHKMGWNVKEAATACGFAAQSWRGWELQGREPHRLTTIAMTIATRTGVDYLWLVHGPDRGGQTVRRSAFIGQRTIGTIGALLGGLSTPSPRDQPPQPAPDFRANDRPVNRTRPIASRFRRSNDMAPA